MRERLAIVSEGGTFLFVHTVLPENTEKYTFYAKQ